MRRRVLASADWLVVDFTPATAQNIGDGCVVRLRPDGASYETLQLPTDSGCRFTVYLHATGLPDGRVGLLRHCVSPEVVRPDTLSLVAYDVRTREVQPLVAATTRFNVTQTWNPTMDRGLATYSSLICAGMTWVTPAGFEPLTAVVRDGTRSWRLDEVFWQDPARDCGDQARADWPAWSPDGRSVAFFASLPARGVLGQSRLSLPWDLYLLDPATRETQRVLVGLKDPRGLAWSPDGTWLAFSQDWREERSPAGQGTWLFAPRTGDLRRLTTTNVDWLAWSPDGRRIVGVRTGPVPPRGLPPSDLLLFDVPELDAKRA